MPHLDAQVVPMICLGNRVTNNINDESIRVRIDFYGEQAALKSWKIDNRLAHSIDWEALIKNMNSWRHWKVEQP